MEKGCSTEGGWVHVGEGTSHAVASDLINWLRYRGLEQKLSKEQLQR
jgi:hypothetical protein